MEQKEVQIDFSTFESEIFKMKVGRVATECFDVIALKQAIVSEEYDLCRLKVPSEAEDTILKLEQIGLPYFFSGSIRRYKTPIKNIPEGKFLHDDIEYEKYDRSKDQLLYDMLVSCWGDYPIGYYRTPFLSEIISKEQEIQCVFKYYQKFNYQPDFPDNTIMFMKRNGEYVGFFALNVIGDRLESQIGGILKPFQKFGYFYDMQEYIRRFCIDNKLDFFCFGARNENGRVQTIFRKFGYEAYGSENVFHIPSLISLKSNNEETVYKEISIASEHQGLAQQQIMNILFSEKSKLLEQHTGNWKTHFVPIKKILKGKYKIEIDHALSTKLQEVVRIKVYQSNQLFGFGNISITLIEQIK